MNLDKTRRPGRKRIYRSCCYWYWQEHWWQLFSEEAGFAFLLVTAITRECVLDLPSCFAGGASWWQATYFQTINSHPILDKDEKTAEHIRGLIRCPWYRSNSACARFDIRTGYRHYKISFYKPLPHSPTTTNLTTSSSSPTSPLHTNHPRSKQGESPFAIMISSSLLSHKQKKVYGP